MIFFLLVNIPCSIFILSIFDKQPRYMPITAIYFETAKDLLKKIIQLIKPLPQKIKIAILNSILEQFRPLTVIFSIYMIVSSVYVMCLLPHLPYIEYFLLQAGFSIFYMLLFVAPVPFFWAILTCIFAKNNLFYKLVKGNKNNEKNTTKYVDKS